jgi:hypothetical protein
MKEIVHRDGLYPLVKVGHLEIRKCCLEDRKRCFQGVKLVKLLRHFVHPLIYATKAFINSREP